MNLISSYRLFVSLISAVNCIVLPGLLVELYFFEVLLKAAKSGSKSGACSLQVRTSVVLSFWLAFAFRVDAHSQGISSRASLDSLLDLRPEGAVSCMLISATVSCPFRPAHCNEDTRNYGV